MKKLLLIEDNPEMRENTAEILEFAGYEVVTASNGRIGIQMAREVNPDLILCDIMMPEMDGYAVLFHVNKDSKTAGIPFIFLTAKADKSEIRKGMNLGADDYLTKPYEEMELLDAIESRFKRNEIVRKEFTNDLPGLNAFLDEARGKEALGKLSADRRIRQFKRKDTIYYEGEHPNHLYFIVKGKVKGWRMNEDAKELITDLYKQGDFLGYLPLIGNMPYSETATALEDTEVAMIPKDDFLELFHRDRDVAYRFIKMLASNVQEKEEKLLSLAYSSVRARVAEALLHLRDRYQEKGTGPFSISISRDDLAGMVGTATESLIRTLSEFKNEHLLEISGREITVLDTAGLERARQYY
jgi:CRP/FNR family transcriptional regulator, polysaccharide utilization system transcription regulator